MRGVKQTSGAGYSPPAYLGRGSMRGVKQTSGTGYNFPAYLGRGQMWASTANFRCRLQFSCLLRPEVG